MTDKQKLFVEEYVIDRNATQAAIRAGYSARTANKKIGELLADRDIRVAIDLKLAELTVRNELTADRVIQEYMKLAFYDTDEFYDIYYAIASWKKGYKRARRRYGSKLSLEEFNKLPSKYKDFYTRTKSLKELGDMDETQRKAIVGISYDKNSNMVLKLADKQKALESLSKHLGIFEADNKQKTIDPAKNPWTVTIVKPGDSNE